MTIGSQQQQPQQQQQQQQAASTQSLLKLLASPRACRILDQSLLSAKLRQRFLGLVDSIDPSCLFGARGLQQLCTHTVDDPATGQARAVHSLLLAENSRFFDLLIKYSGDRHLKLPYAQYQFLRQGIGTVLDAIATDGGGCGDSRQCDVSIREDNCIEIYQTADYLLCSDLRARVLAYIEAQCSTNLGLALHIWNLTETVYLPELNAVAFDRLLRSFTAAIQEPLWLELGVDLVRRLLRHDGINCASELSVLDAAVRWLSAAWPEREVHGESLLACVRRGLLKPGELVRFVQHPALARYPRLLAMYRGYPVLSADCLDLYHSHLDAFKAAATPREPHEAVMLFGGWCQQVGPRAACQVFNPRANAWTMWAPNAARPANDIGQVERRVYSGCLVVNDILHLLGGYDGERALNTVLCYNLRTQSGWYEGSCMVFKRYYVCCAAIGTVMYAIGGHNGDTQDRFGGRLDSVERTDINDNSWLPVASMRTVRSDAGAAALNGRIYVAGGFNGQNYHDTAEVYDPATDQWSFISRMNFARGGVSLVALGKKLYAIGGNDGQSRLAVVEAYQNELDGWAFAGRLRRQKSNLSTAVLEGGIIVMGGWSDQPSIGILASVEKFQPDSVTDATDLLADMTYAASATSACSISGRDLVTRYLGEASLRRSNPWQAMLPGSAAVPGPRSSVEAGSSPVPDQVEQASPDTHFIQSSQEPE